eukprot:888349-Prorocentrum_minimum.AAC.3
MSSGNGSLYLSSTLSPSRKVYSSCVPRLCAPRPLHSEPVACGKGASVRNGSQRHAGREHLSPDSCSSACSQSRKLYSTQSQWHAGREHLSAARANGMREGSICPQTHAAARAPRPGNCTPLRANDMRGGSIYPQREPMACGEGASVQMLHIRALT